MNFDLKEMNVNPNALPNDAKELQLCLDEYDEIIKNVASGEFDDKLIENIKPLLDSMSPRSAKQIARTMIQIDEGMNYKYGYPKSAIDESEQTLEESLYEMFVDGAKDEPLVKRVLIKPILKKMAKAMALTMKRGIGYLYQQVIPEMKQKAWATFEKGQVFQTDFYTISECSAYYVALVGKEYLTLKQAWEDAIIKECTYFNRNGKQRQITEVSQLRKAWDNINQRSAQEKYGLE